MSPTNRIDLDVQGLDELIANLKSLVPEIADKASRSSLDQVGKEIADQIRRRVPVDRGVLKSNIYAKKSKRTPYGRRVTAGITYGTGGGNHAHLVEFGHYQKSKPGFGRRIVHGFQPAQPFMRPALYSNREKYVELVKQGIDRSLEKLERKALKNGTRFRR